jgi:YD repeat-containing protein
MKKIKFLMVNFISAIGFSQTPAAQLPKVVPATPQTAELTKYIDFPANLSVGLAATEIPIYTVQSSELSVPISLSYDSSGLKPNDDESGLIGLKWSLNAFGVVSRSVSGSLADERTPTYAIPTVNDYASLPNFCGDVQGSYNGSSYSYTNQYQILNNISIGGIDTEPDIFSFRLPTGESNKFLFQKGSTVDNFQPVLLKDSSTKVERVISGTSVFSIASFSITDTKGVYYRFGQNVNNTTSVTETGPKGASSWLLTEMISPTKKDTIFFEYDDVQFYYNGAFSSNKKRFMTSNEIVTSSRNVWVGLGGSPINDNTVYTNNRYPVEYNYSQKKITKIRFKSGYVKFEYQFVDNECVLQYIKVFTSADVLIKTVELKQSKFSDVPSTQLNWFKLDELSFYSNSSSDSQKYLFAYNTGTFPKRSSNMSTYAVDHWGFYNGQNANNSLIPNNIDLSWPEASMGAPSGGNRSANGNSSKIGILESITFPTKGKRKFTYEGNTSNGTQVGGIRIKTITNEDGTNSIVHTFDYGTGGISKSFNNKAYFRDYSVEYQNETHSDMIINQNFTITSEPNFDIFINGSPVIYQTVNEFIGTATTNTGRITHYFNGGTNLTQYIASHSCGIGNLGVGYPYNTQVLFQGLPIYYYQQYFPDVNETITEYRDVQNNIVKKVENYYNTTPLGEVSKAFKSKRIVTLFYVVGGPNYSLKEFQFYNYSFYKTQNRLGYTKTTEYENSQPTLTIQNSYNYNDYGVLSSETTVSSLGSTLKTEYKYATDLNGVEQSPYMSQLATANRISEPIITKTFNDAEKTFENHVKYVSSSATNNIILPIEIHQNKGEGNIDITTLTDRRILFTKYGKWGNPLECQQDGGMPITYLWDKNGINPIAKIENATFAQVIAALSTTETAIQNLTTSPSNLRTVLPNAMVTTYTYKTLVGVETITDPKGDTFYYEYDNFGRLKAVRDKDNNLLSESMYNYRPN